MWIALEPIRCLLPCWDPTAVLRTHLQGEGRLPHLLLPQLLGTLLGNPNQSELEASGEEPQQSRARPGDGQMARGWTAGQMQLTGAGCRSAWTPKAPPNSLQTTPVSQSTWERFYLQADFFWQPRNNKREGDTIIISASEEGIISFPRNASLADCPGPCRDTHLPLTGSALLKFSCPREGQKAEQQGKQECQPRFPTAGSNLN